MPKFEIAGTLNRKKVLEVHYGGSQLTDPGDVLLVDPVHGYYDGVALRDALIEAFPLDPSPSNTEAPGVNINDLLESAQAYAKDRANAEYGRAFNDFIQSLNTKESK